MRVTLLVLFVLVLGILFVTYPFKFKALLHINALKDVGFGAVKVMHVRLFCARFNISSTGKLNMDSGIKKKKKKKKPVTFRKVYFTCLAKLLTVKKVEILFDGGCKDSAYLVALLNGYINALSAIGVSWLINKYRHIRVFYNASPYFNENRLEISGSVVVAVSLLDIFLSVIYAYYCYKKEVIRRAKNDI